MTFEIPQQVLSWMENENNENNRTLFGWDLIFAVPLMDFNRALRDSTLGKFIAGHAAEGLSGSFTLDDSTQAHYLDNYQYSRPSIDVKATDYGTAKLRVSAVLDGGLHIRTRGNFNVLTLNKHLPSNALDAQLDLPFEYVDGHLCADLGNATGHSLKLSEEVIGQEKSAQLLKEMLGALGKERRQILLAQVQPGEDNPLRKVKEVYLRTQNSSQTPGAMDDSPKSVLIFVKFEHGGRAFMPVVGDTFPFLLGGDGQGGQGCTVMLSRHLMHRVSFGQSIMAVLEGARWEYGSDADGGPLPWIQTAQGHIQVAAGRHQTEHLDIEYAPFSIEVTSNAPLRLEFNAGNASQRWQPRCTINMHYSLHGNGDRQKHSVVVEPELHLRLAIKGSEKGPGLLEGRWTDMSTQQAIVNHLPQALSPELAQEMAVALEAIVLSEYLNAVNSRPLLDITEQVLPVLRMFGGQDLRWEVGAVPNNIVVVGTFGDSTSTFHIAQQEVLLAAEQSMNFTVHPPRPGLKWSLAPLPGYGKNLGHIDEGSGQYTAPKASDFPGDTLRVEVIAHDPATGQRSSAMASVNALSVMMAPLFQYLIRGHDQNRIDFAALSASDDEYLWEVIGGEVPTKGHFEPGTSTFLAGPQQQEYTFIVDRVRLTSRKTGATVNGIVLSEHLTPQLTIVCAQTQRPEEPVKLEAYYGSNTQPTPGIQWSHYGPGRIEGDYYYPDLNTADAFVLIIGTWDRGVRGLYQGYEVLPLPLTRFSRLRAAQAGRRLQWRAPGSSTGRVVESEEEGSSLTFPLLPNVDLTVAPGSIVSFMLAHSIEGERRWRVERKSGDASGVGRIDQQGLYTAGDATIGVDEVIVEVWTGNIRLGEGRSKQLTNIPVQPPHWGSLKSCYLETGSGGVASIYGNAYCQLQVNVSLETNGGKLDLDERQSLRFYLAGTLQELPVVEGESLERGFMWGVNKKRNRFKLMSTTGVLEQEQFTYYLHSRAEDGAFVDILVGIRDVHNAYHYSRISEGGGGRETIKVSVAVFNVGNDDFKFLPGQRERVDPPPINNDPEEQFGRILTSIDYWFLSAPPQFRFFECEWVKETEQHHDSLVRWEAHYAYVEEVSYTGWQFWPSEDTAVAPTALIFDKSLPTLCTRFKPKHIEHTIDRIHLKYRGLIVGVFRREDIRFWDVDEKEALTYRQVKFKVLSDYGHSIYLVVSFDTATEGRERDYLMVASASKEW